MSDEEAFIDWDALQKELKLNGDEFLFADTVIGDVTEIKKEELIEQFKHDDQMLGIHFPDLKRIFKCGCREMCNDCINLERATFPELFEVDEMGMQECFRHCLKLTEVSFPKLKAVSIHSFNNTFMDCQNLKSIEFPSLTQVGNNGFFYTFFGCTNLEMVTFDSLEWIFPNAFFGTFYHCKNLKDVFMPNLKKIEGEWKPMFKGCPDVRLHLPYELSGEEKEIAEGCGITIDRLIFERDY